MTNVCQARCLLCLGREVRRLCYHQLGVCVCLCVCVCVCVFVGVSMENMRGGGHGGVWDRGPPCCEPWVFSPCRTRIKQETMPTWGVMQSPCIALSSVTSASVTTRWKRLFSFASLPCLLLTTITLCAWYNCHCGRFWTCSTLTISHSCFLHVVWKINYGVVMGFQSLESAELLWVCWTAARAPRYNEGFFAKKTARTLAWTRAPTRFPSGCERGRVAWQR
jgi:hypothetical protein